ncbi:MAG TPA: DUF2207 domain-containing protein [Gemmatimonadota bacterium]|nr:DUF2207 domain-containing protein [Gemmatimonadota bacterium]
MSRRPGLVLVAAALTLSPAATRAQDTGWTIEQFHADYVVHEDRTLGVIERIAVDFDGLQRHGIYRTIPVRYKRLVSPGAPLQAGRVTFSLRVRGVTDANGAAIPYQVSGAGEKEIKIGDPGRTVTGDQIYVIDYVLSGGLGFFDAVDELYWQVTGTNWPVPIERASATVLLPPERAAMFADSAPWQAHCYAGGPRSTSDAGCTARVVSPGVYRFETTGPLGPGEGLTLAAGFPKGLIAPPPATERAREGALKWGPLAIPFLAFGLLFALWRRHGKEPPIGSVVPTWRPSAELRPGTAGALVDQRTDMDDVIATILDLAVRGYVRIVEVPPEIPLGLEADSLAGKILGGVMSRRKDWELVRLRKEEEGGLLGFERETLRAIFGGAANRRLSDLKNEFYRALPGIQEAIDGELVARRLFARRPSSTRTLWMVLGAIVLLGGGALGVVALTLGYWAVLPAFLVSGLLVLVFGWHMPAMTAAGARVRREVEGLEEYIRRSEKAEIEFRDAPEKSPELFSALLPYAVALDVSDLWVGQFEGILTAPPEWYAGSMRGFSSGGFNDSLSSFRSSAASTLQSSPGSSSGSGGGGSVGGGGGGGGGGSW